MEEQQLLAVIEQGFAGVRGELHEQFGGLRHEFGGLRSEFGGLREQFGELRSEFGGLREQFGVVQEQLGVLHEEVGILHVGMGQLTNDVRELGTMMERLEDRIESGHEAFDHFSEILNERKTQWDPVERRVSKLETRVDFLERGRRK